MVLVVVGGLIDYTVSSLSYKMDMDMDRIEDRIGA